MSETIIMSADSLYRWKGPKMKSTLMGTKLGTLVLTNQRLLFLSSGKNDVLKRAAGAAVGGGIGGLAAAESTANLDLSALANEGSMDIPLATIIDTGWTKKMFSNFLWVTLRAADGSQEAWTFATQHGLAAGAQWETSIKTACAA